MMKRTLTTIIGLILAFGLLGVVQKWGGRQNFLNESGLIREIESLQNKGYEIPCSIIDLRIGEIDPGFNVSTEEVKNALTKAEDIWEAGLGKKLFEEKEDAPLTVNLVYDERQERLIKRTRLEQFVSLKRDEYVNQENIYNKQVEQYNQIAANYEANMKKYSEEVDYWNAKGGAPKDVYSRLENERIDGIKIAEQLRAMAAEIEKNRNILEGKRAELNSYVDQLNVLAAPKGNATTTKEVAGIYFQGPNEDPKIEIYQFFSKEDLAKILAHELGHALGMGHDLQRSSIMYDTTNDSQGMEITEEDKALYAGRLDGKCN